MKTLKEANLLRRNVVKNKVRNYFINEGIENFNWVEFGSTIIKQELSSYYDSIIVSFDTILKQYVILDTYNNEILAK